MGFEFVEFRCFLLGGRIYFGEKVLDVENYVVLKRSVFILIKG